MQTLKKPFYQAVRNICLSTFTLLVALGMKSPFQDGSESRETQVKAAFLYNFTQFIEWPMMSFNDHTSPFIIGVVGQNTFGVYLNEIIENENVHGHPIIIKHYTSASPDIAECQILFIDKSFPLINKVIDGTLGKPILTVSDHKNFTKQSGMLKFYIESGKLRIEINQQAVTNSGLEVSSKLLRIATLYQP